VIDFKAKLAAMKAAGAVAAPSNDSAAPLSGLVLKGSPAPAPAGLAATSMVTGRQLGFPDSGEHVPLRFESDGVDPRWSQLAHHYETDLCVAVHADNPDVCWLALRANDQHGPLLLHKLPLLHLNNDEPPF